MLDSLKNKDQTFQTDHPLAFVSGWLIVPAVATLLTFLGSIIMVTFQKPSTLKGFDLFIYYTDLFYIPFLLIVFYMWIRRKKALPILMIIYFLISAAWNITFLAYGFAADVFNLGMSLIWIIYFLKSERVKATFVN